MRLSDLVSIMPYDQGVRGEMSIEGDILPLRRKVDNMVALKISGNPDKHHEAKRLLDIPVLCGWDLMSLLAYEMGSDGVISGSATLVPQHEVRLFELAMAKEWDEARELYYDKIVPLLNYCTFDPFAYSAAADSAALTQPSFWNMLVSSAISCSSHGSVGGRVSPTGRPTAAMNALMSRFPPDLAADLCAQEAIDSLTRSTSACASSYRACSRSSKSLRPYGGYAAIIPLMKPTPPFL